MANTPRGREKNVTGQGKSVYKRGEGLGTGPVGNEGGYQGRPDTGSGNSGGGSGRETGTRAGGRGPLLLIIIVAAVLIFGGGGAGLSGLLGGGSIDTEYWLIIVFRDHAVWQFTVFGYHAVWQFTVFRNYSAERGVFFPVCCSKPGSQ